MQWLKLNNRDPFYNIIVDKYLVKQYVENKVGKQYIIPLLGVWNHFDEIDFHKLPNQFVLKTNHDCGGVVVCKDKSGFDYKKAKDKLERHLKNKYYWEHREWPYKDIKPLIFAEKCMVDESGYELKDYKWFCFNGEPKSYSLLRIVIIPKKRLSSISMTLSLNTFLLRMAIRMQILLKKNHGALRSCRSLQKIVQSYTTCTCGFL